MMKKITIIIFAAVAALTGCNRVLIEPSGNGYFSLGLSAEGEYVDVQISKALANDDKKEFKVGLYTASGTEYMSFDRYAEMPQVIELVSGSYILKVQSPSALPAAFDQPVYGAEEAFEVKVGETCSKTVVCTLQNVKVSLDLSESFLSGLESYTISVANGTETENILYWTNIVSFEEGQYLTKDITRPGYFAAAPLTIRVDGKRTTDGSTAYLEKSFQNVNPRDHITISIDANVTGSAGFDIQISTDVNPKNEEVFIPSFEETPVPDDDEEETPGDTGDDNTGDDNTGDDNTGGTAPAGDMTMTWAGHTSVDNVYPAVPIDEYLGEVALAINVPGKIAGFVVDINSEDAVFAGAVMEMTTDGNTSLDLINDPKAIEALGPNGVGLNLNLEGETDVIFDLTNLIPLISFVAAPDTDHEFVLTVTDENGYSESWKLTFSLPASN